MTIDTGTPTGDIYMMADITQHPTQNGSYNGATTDDTDSIDSLDLLDMPHPTTAMKTKKKDKSKHKKVSFNVDFNEVLEIPVVEVPPSPNGNVETENGATCNGHSVDIIADANIIEDEEEEEEDTTGQEDKENEIDFLKKFANLRKLESVIRANSEKQEVAEKEHMEAQLARARQILKKRSRRQELAKLIPGEELERLLGAVNMQQEYVVQRESRKFMTSRRGKTSFIYLAGSTSGDKEEQEGRVEVQKEGQTENATTFSQTFGANTSGGLL